MNTRIRYVGAMLLLSLCISHRNLVATGSERQTWDSLRGQGPAPTFLPYRIMEEGSLHLHIYNPPPAFASPRPAILFFHGGGWANPGIWHLAPLCRYFAARGMVAINVEYRLVQNDPPIRMDDCLSDAKAALLYVQENAADLGIDPAHIVVAGESAGGHLAAALALLPEDASHPPHPEPSAVLLLNPVLDLATLAWTKKHLALAPRTDTDTNENWQSRAHRLSPIQHVRPNLPPTFLLHGAADTVVPIEQADRFAAAMRASGNPITYHRMPGWPHAFAIEGYGSEEQIIQTIRHMDAFLADLGCLQGEPSIGMPWQPQAFHPTFSERQRLQQAHVQARSHDLRFWPFLDGQWLGIVPDQDGYTWFSFSTHSGTEHAQVFRYDPQNDRIQHIGDLGQATDEKLTGHPPQDKIHGNMFVDGDWIYAGTCEGHAIPGNPYRGGYWLKINRHTGTIHNLGKSISEDGLLAVGYDPVHRRLYGHTNRKGWLTRLERETGIETFVGIPWQGVIDAWQASDDPHKPREIWPRGLDLMITPDGRVFGTKPSPGTFWVYDPAADTITTFQLEMPLPRNLQDSLDTDGQPDPAEWRRWQQSAFHMSAWDEQDQCFYLIRSYDQMLCRFYPPTGKHPARIETLHEMGLSERRYNLRPAACVLVIMDRTVYYTPHTGWGGITHLTSYDLEHGVFQDHGPIVVEGGRYVNENHAMTASADGTLHLAAFVYSKPGSPDPQTPWSMRDRYPFHSRFVILDPSRDLHLPHPTHREPATSP